MAEPSKQRISAESNFLKTQTQSLARNHILSEADSISQQRDNNMARLKHQRLEKEAADRHAAIAAAASKKQKKPRNTSPK